MTFFVMFEVYNLNIDSLLHNLEYLHMGPKHRYIILISSGYYVCTILSYRDFDISLFLIFLIVLP